MTDTTITPDTETPPDAETPPDVPDAAPAPQPAATADEPPAAPPEAPQDDDRRSPEAAKYRFRLRAAEAERDDARAHITELQSEVIRQMLAGKLADPSDFDQIGVAAVLGDDGRIDRDKLDTAITTLLEQKPHYAPRTNLPRMRPQPRSGEQPTADARPKTESKLHRAFPGSGTRWAEVIGNGERGASTEARTSRVRSEVSKMQDL